MKNGLAEVGDVFYHDIHGLFVVVDMEEYTGTKLMWFNRNNHPLFMDGYSNIEACCRGNKYVGNIKDVFVSIGADYERK